MDYEKYDSMLRTQVLSLPGMVQEQVESCFNEQKLRSSLPVEQAKTAKRVFISGCGDSNPVGTVLLKTFKELSGIEDCFAMDPMEFSRYLKKEDFGQEGESLAIAVSARGGSARISEMLLKADACGGVPILITDGRKSKAAEKARYCYFLDAPPMANAVPGLRSYFSCLVGFLAAGCSIGLARESLTLGRVEGLAEQITRYVQSYDKLMEEWDQKCFETAWDWREFKRFEFVGNASGVFSAYFSSMKFYESSGVCCRYVGVDDWVWAEQQGEEADKVGTMFLLHKSEPGYQKGMEMALSASKKRRIMVISDDNQLQSTPNVTFVPLIPPKDGAGWLVSLMDYCPASLVASAHCMMSGRKKKYYKDADGKIRTEDPTQMKFLNPELKTQHNSRCEIHL